MGPKDTLVDSGGTMDKQKSTAGKKTSQAATEKTDSQATLCVTEVDTSYEVRMFMWNLRMYGSTCVLIPALINIVYRIMRILSNHMTLPIMFQGNITYLIQFILIIIVV